MGRESYIGDGIFSVGEFPKPERSHYPVLCHPDHTLIVLESPNTIHRKRSMKTATSPQQAELDEIVGRIVEVASPEQVLIFGSTARGTPGTESDLDFLVIKSGRYNARTLAGLIYRRMRGIARSIDLVIVTPQQVKEYRNSPFSVVYPALREGRVVYERKKAIS